MATIITFLAAWIEANRKPNLQFRVAEKQHPDIKQIHIVLSPNENTKSAETRLPPIQLEVYLSNHSPVPARFPQIEVELQLLTQRPKQVHVNWTELAYIQVRFNPDFDQLMEESIRIRTM